MEKVQWVLDEETGKVYVDAEQLAAYLRTEMGQDRRPDRRGDREGRADGTKHTVGMAPSK
jgi:hypothetical protein